MYVYVLICSFYCLASRSINWAAERRENGCRMRIIIMMRYHWYARSQPAFPSPQMCSTEAGRMISRIPFIHENWTKRKQLTRVCYSLHPFENTLQPCLTVKHWNLCSIRNSCDCGFHCQLRKRKVTINAHWKSASTFPPLNNRRGRHAFGLTR